MKRTFPQESSVVDLGYITHAVHGTTSQHLWDVMKQEIKSVANYLPVTNVRCLEFKGYMRRSLTYIEDSQNAEATVKLWHHHGLKKDATIVENIYCDETKREIRYVELDQDNNEIDEEFVHALVMIDQLTPSIEYFKRNRKTKERVHCDMPTAEARNEIERTAEVARVVQRSYGNSAPWSKSKR
jgi:hypothetical protein